MARILYITQGYCTHDRRFIERIGAKHDVWFVSCEACSIQRSLPNINAAIHWLPPLAVGNLAPGSLGCFAAARRLRWLIRKLAPDLVHAGPLQTGGYIAALSGFHPLLIMSWGSDALLIPEKSAWLKWITRFTLQRADMAVADCDAVGQRIAALGGLALSRIVTFPWGVDLARFQRKISALQLRRRLGWEGCKVLISTRAFEPIYGTMAFLDAAKEALTRLTDVRVLMLGDGSLRNAVELFIERNGLSTKIYLAGQVPEEMLPDYFAEADLYVSAAQCDGSSISLLQAMACGLPVIVCDSYGNNEWVTDGDNGWLYPAGNADALLTKILQALGDYSGRVVAGQANAQIARERADWSRNVSKLLSAYDQLLEHKNVKEVPHAQYQNR